MKLYYLLVLNYHVKLISVIGDCHACHGCEIRALMVIILGYEMYRLELLNTTQPANTFKLTPL